MEVVVDRDRLVAALRELGVDWLAPSDAQGAPIADEALVASLAAHEDPRLRQALIGLFLLHPELGEIAPRVRGQMTEEAGRELIVYYLAAVYLQEMWRIRLSRYLPPQPRLHDYFSRALGLPPREDEHGSAGLYALAEWHSAHAPVRFNYRSAYEGTADLLFQCLKLKRRRHEHAAAG